jgi:hypothetical protein
MPAYNNGPRSTATDPSSAPLANPALGMPVIMSPFSGPKNSPFDAQVWPTNVWPPAAGSRVNDPLNVSTGALSTGIGFGLNAKVPGIQTSTMLPVGNDQSGYNDDYTPGVTTPAGGVAADGRYLSIGGGKCNAPTLATFGVATPVPYIALPLLAFGNGASRDAGTGPVYTGFSIKTVTAVADVAAAAAIETGYQNRSGVTVKSGASQFGSNTTSSPVVS